MIYYLQIRVCRAAFMCGREPNFELSEKDKEALRKLSWEEYLAITRSEINSKSKKRILNFNLF